MTGARGEQTFQAGSREVTVLYTNRALAGAEKRLGKGIVGVAQGLLEGSSGLTEVAVLLQVGMEASRIDTKAGGRSVSLEDAYGILDRAGFGTVAAAVMQAVAAVLGYSGEPTPEDDPAPNA